MSVINPIGEQCPKCGYTLCHDCLKKTPTGVGFAVYSHECPHGCGVKLTTPVRPTGRKNLQFSRRVQPVTHVFLFREGPIQPDVDYVRISSDTQPRCLRKQTADLRHTGRPLAGGWLRRICLRITDGKRNYR